VARGLLVRLALRSRVLPCARSAVRCCRTQRGDSQAPELPLPRSLFALHCVSCPPRASPSLCCRRYGFCVQMLVLPLHMEFTRRGEFTVLERLAAAARCVAHVAPPCSHGPCPG
jgi:hypothetical protein